jgi:perosamine synthetase
VHSVEVVVTSEISSLGSAKYKYRSPAGRWTRTADVHMPIPLIEPVVGVEEERLIAEVLSSGWLSEGPMTKRFEELVRAFTGAKHAVAASSCTTAMEMGLRAMGIGHGDTVIVPDFTHPATIDAVIAVGARPVLVDVDLYTYNIDHDEARKAAAKKARAAIPVSWAGYPLDKRELDSLKSDYEMLILEDAACSLGSEYRRVKTGTMADITCLSFHPRKVLTTGEGGMATTDNDEYDEKLRSFKNFGASKVGGQSRFVRYGSNYKMSDVLAAIGVAQMAKLASIIERRIELAEYYGKLLSEIDGIRAPQKIGNVRHIYQTYAAYIEVEEARNKLIDYLRSVGVEAQIGTYALHMQPYCQDVEKQGDLSRSKLLFENLIALPMCHKMTRENQEYVVFHIGKFLREFRGRNP